jgi:hypothetical protein
MTALNDHQFELLDAGAGSGLVFGYGCTIALDEDGFLPAGDDYEDQDQNDPYRGIVRQGRDVRTPQPWGFNLYVDVKDTPEEDGTDESVALEAMSTVRKAWAAPVSRQANGPCILRYKIAGRVRRIFGRPGKLAISVNNRILGGYIPITTEFRPLSAYTYDDVASTHSLAEGSTFAATIGGELEAWPILTFNGPLTNPSFITDDWTLALTCDIADGDSVVVDLRPWSLGVTLTSDGTQVPDYLDPTIRLSNLSFEPGDLNLSLDADSGTGTCDVEWSNTYYSL